MKRKNEIRVFFVSVLAIALLAFAQKAQAAHAHILRQQQLANQAAQASYKHTFSDAMLDIENQRTQEVFDIKLGLYDDQIEINKFYDIK